MDQQKDPATAAVEQPALRPDGTPWPYDVPQGPLNDDDLGVLGKVNSDGNYVSYPVTKDSQEGLPESVRERRANRAMVPKGWVLRAKRTDGKSQEYWQQIAKEVMDKTGFSPVAPDVYQKEIAGRFAVMEGYTTLDRIEMAIQTCQRKLAQTDLSEEFQIEWMTQLQKLFAMQKEHLAELKKSAEFAEKKNQNMAKPKNLPPAFVLQQTFNGKPPETKTITDDMKVIDSPKAIGES